MEHLLLPTGVELTEQEEIPYVSSETYRGKPFLEYPAYANPSFNIPSDKTTAYFQAGPSPLGLVAFQSFLQTWLFFGLLQEVLSTSFRHNDFVRCIADDLTSRNVLSTAKLRELIDVWVDHVINDAGFDHSRAEHLLQCFRVADFALSTAEAGFDAKLKFAIAATAETLMYAVNRVCELKGIDLTFTEQVAWNMFDDPEFRSESYQLSGWCAAQASRISDFFQSCLNIHFLSHIIKTQTEQGHGNCSPEKCVAAQVNLDRYTLSHFPAHCKCNNFTMDQELVFKILQKGRIPLLDLHWDEKSAKISVVVVESQKDSLYVAISHVWADGLGNPRDNMLPLCQLRRLVNLLTQFERRSNSKSGQRRPYLWIDTLCCPTKPEDAKKLSLSYFPSTYREATHVLVLESSLLEIRQSPLQRVEVLARICTSSWMYRLWTLQEGFLAKRLWVQFDDGVIELRELTEAVAAIKLQTPSIENLDQLLVMADELRFVPGKYKAGDLFYLAVALKFRSVTVESDEPLLVATFLGLDVGLIVKEEADKRMKCVWSSIDNARQIIPRDMIFYVGPRMTIPGFRWAPSTFLRLKDFTPFSTSNDAPRASVCERGLMLSCAAFPISMADRADGILTRSTLRALDTMDFLRDETNHWYVSSSSIDQREHASDLGREKTTEAGLNSIYEILAHGDSTFEVLVRKPLGKIVSQIDCLLVKVMEVDAQGTKFVHACRQFVLTSLDQATSDLLSCVFRQAQAMQQAEITQEIIRTGKNGKQDPLYLDTLRRFLGEANLFVDQFMEYSQVNVPQTYLGLNEYPRKTLFALLSRFYRNRHLIIGNMSPDSQSYCVD